MQKQAFNEWIKVDQLQLLARRRQTNFIEDIFVAWKRRVAFKGGHSIHNHALKLKAWSSFVKHKKAAKVKQFRIESALKHYRNVLKATLIRKLGRACKASRLRAYEKSKVQARIDKHRRFILLRKSTTAWKKFSYRVRVQNYLE